MPKQKFKSLCALRWCDVTNGTDFQVAPVVLNRVCRAFFRASRWRSFRAFFFHHQTSCNKSGTWLTAHFVSSLSSHVSVAIKGSRFRKHNENRIRKFSTLAKIFSFRNTWGTGRVASIGALGELWSKSATIKCFLEYPFVCYDNNPYSVPGSEPF